VFVTAPYESVTMRWLGWGRAYARLSVFRRRKSIASQLLDFVRSGDLWVYDRNRRLDAETIAAEMERPAPPPEPIPEPGEAVEIAADLAALADLCEAIQTSGKLALVGIDPAGVGLIVEALKTKDIFEEEPNKPAPTTPLIGVSQGYRLQGAIKTSERMLEDQTLLHADQPILSWSAGNARTELKGNAALITKAASGTAKIDPLMACFVTVALMATNPEPRGSVYTADRGLLTFG
jgi:phage terminase large subunit-like protein